MTLRAGDGLNLNFDGSQIEISLARPDWFVAKITGALNETEPIAHKWIKQQLKQDGTWEDAKPVIFGDGVLNPAYKLDGTLHSNGLVYMRQRRANGWGIPEYEILGSTDVWFVARITGSTSTSEPYNHQWVRQQFKTNIDDETDGTYENSTDTGSNAYTLDGKKASNGLVFMRPRVEKTSVSPPVMIYEFISLGTTTGGPATLEVVTDVVCTPNGLEVSTATLAGANYDVAIIRQFLSLSDVVPKSFLGNQGRVVRVNDTATGLEFGPVAGNLAQTFIALEDTPLIYGNSAYKVLTVNSTNNGVTFSANNITSQYSVSGGGNPNNPTPNAWLPLQLKGDLDAPGNDKYYGTDASGERGWYASPDIDAIETELTDHENRITILESDVESLQSTVQTHTTQIADLDSDLTQLKTTVDGHTASITSLDGRVSAIENAPYATQAYVTTAVASEASIRSSADSALDGRVTTLEGTVAGHAASISTLTTGLTSAQGSISTLQGQMTTAQGDISTLQSSVSTLQSNLNTETTNRVNADNALDGRLTTAEGTLASHTSTLSTHSTDISTLQTNLSTETTNRTNADNGLDSRISTLEGQTLNTRLNTLESQTLDTRLSTLEGQTLDSRISTLEGQTLDTRLSTLEGQTLDSRLTTLEGQTLDTRLSTLESQTLDTRLSTLEGQTLDTRVATLEGQTLDTRLSTLEGQTLDTRLATLEGQTLDSRITTLEGQTLDTRLTTLEGQTLDSRLTTVESHISGTAVTLSGTQVVGTQQAAVADAVGGTIVDTSVADCASSTQTAVDDLKTQLNALLAALRAHGLIAS